MLCYAMWACQNRALESMLGWSRGRVERHEERAESVSFWTLEYGILASRISSMERRGTKSKETGAENLRLSCMAMVRRNSQLSN